VKDCTSYPPWRGVTREEKPSSTTTQRLLAALRGTSRLYRGMKTRTKWLFNDTSNPQVQNPPIFTMNGMH